MRTAKLTALGTRRDPPVNLCGCGCGRPGTRGYPVGRWYAAGHAPPEIANPPAGRADRAEPVRPPRAVRPAADLFEAANVPAPARAKPFRRP